MKNEKKNERNDAQLTHKKIKNNNLSSDYDKRSKLVANAQSVFNANGEFYQYSCTYVPKRKNVS